MCLCPFIDPQQSLQFDIKVYLFPRFAMAIKLLSARNFVAVRMLKLRTD
jgi:hypothetical protein